jgi:hypothetical protein
MIHSFTKTKDKVKYILEKYPITRDDDNKMIWQFIFFESGGSDHLNNITGLQFLCDLANGHYTSPESIRRMRQKIQEQYPELRGNSYNIRHKIANETKNKINEL